MTPFFIHKIQGISRTPLQTIKRIRQLSEFKEVSNASSNSKNNGNINPIQKTLQQTIRYHLDPSNNAITYFFMSLNF